MQSVRGRSDAGVRGGVSHARHRGGPAGGDCGAAGLDHRAAGLALAGTDQAIRPVPGAERGPGLKEWPLILFTLATQLACGLTRGATVFETKARPADAVLMRPLAIEIFPVLALGILVSM